MLVTCAGRGLKQPIELDIPEVEYVKIQALGSPREQNDAIAAYAKNHVKKYGYDLGICKDRKRAVDFNACINCGMNQGQNQSAWARCKYKNLEYKYTSSKATVVAQKKVDEKIEKKLELTPEELAMAKNLYITD